MGSWHNDRNLWGEKTLKLIKINEFSFIETDDQSLINRATLNNLTIIDIPKNPNDYKPDGSDRPETIKKIRDMNSLLEVQKEANEESRIKIIRELLVHINNKKDETELKQMRFSDLSDYANTIFNS